MKYLEQIKSIMLIALVVLSVVLTFSIWSYHPNYETVQKEKPYSVMMEKKRELSTIVLPYRLLVHRNGEWTGTSNADDMQPLLKQMKNWELSDMTPVSSNFSVSKLNDLLLLDNRLVLQFDSEVPMPIFQSFITISNKKIPEVSFDHMIISWNEEDDDNSKADSLTVFFSNAKQKQLYRAKIKVKNFEKVVLSELENYPAYVPLQRDQTSTLFLSKEPTKLSEYKYLMSNISIDNFKNALFNDAKIVKMSPDEKQGIEKYSDDRSIMTVDKSNYIVSFVNSTATENQENIPRTNLISSTFDFINEHGGWTGDYRYSSIDYGEQRVDYQLFVETLPILKTDVGTTKIETYWGNGRIYRYIRPTYKLAYLPQERNKQVKLISGEKMAQKLMTKKGVDFNKISSLRTGFVMEKDVTRTSIYILEPTWFYRINGKWIAVGQKDATVGGDSHGLE